MALDSDWAIARVGMVGIVWDYEDRGGLWEIVGIDGNCGVRGGLRRIMGIVRDFGDRGGLGA